MFDPDVTGRNYDKIAQWWHEQHAASEYGLLALRRAMGFCKNTKTALDVGCGAGGRFVRTMESGGFWVTGVDVSCEMVKLAKKANPEHTFIHADICTWETDEKFDLITAWDSIFHLPLSMHEPVLKKLCDMLKPDGVLMYTFGDAEGEHTDTWHNEQYYYSSVGIKGNIEILGNCGLTPVHLELDQFPLNHAVIIGCKRNV